MVTKEDINRIPNASIRQLLNDLPNEFPKQSMDIESFEFSMSKGLKPDIMIKRLPMWDGTIKVSIVINLVESSL